ncbi:uncharacterized protein [Leptinotarsa decemlineata]|uniref:uncharacterized protein n=1 Tax=Leptinotarsa decemlineata TaxID=7539 RepID=UPI003D3040D6
MFLFSVTLVLTLQFSFLSGAPSATECEIDPFSANAPLLIENGKSSIIYPQYGERTIRFPAGHVVELSCPQREVLTNGKSSGSIVVATCVSGERFKMNGQTFNWEKIVCSGVPVSTSRITNGKCGKNGQSAEIGFNLDNSRFLTTMEICFDTEKQIALYSHFEMSSTISISSSDTPRPQFHEDSGFYHLNGEKVNNLYVRKGQRKTINGLLGLSTDSVKYIQNGVLYLARGHLTARADFVYAAEENSTFKYINAAPQWQSINAANWKQVEMDTRNYANAHKVGLQVWTGTYGVASLPHEKTGKDIELYLYANSDYSAIPVPALYWKIVYNPVNKRGIVLIGVNNPFLKEEQMKKYIICRDVSDSVSWLKWKKSNIAHGYSYACTVPDFRKVVTYAPSLTVSGLLDTWKNDQYLSKMLFVTFFLLFVQFLLVSNVNATGCEVDPFALDTPLLITNGKSSIIYPKYNERTVKFDPGETVEFSCAQRFVVLDGNQTDPIVTATCISGETFSIFGEVYSWSRISCNYHPLPVGRFTNGNCSSLGRNAEIGFVLDDHRFLRTMKICFDTTNQAPLYSQFELSSTIAVNAEGIPRPSFHVDDGFYRIYDGSLKHLYVREAEQSTVNKLLGLSENSQKYIHNGDLFFLSKGHLSANGDFVYAAQKNSTFRYINTAPQWQSINGFNWNQVETDTRHYATMHNVTLRVWTGTYGVTTLPHETTGEETELYLYVHSGHRGLPLPAIFWKLVYDPLKKKGVVLVTVNNPHLNQDGVKKYVVCKDISRSVTWLKWDKDNIAHGYSYACSVQDFRNVVSYVPKLDVTGLLI